MPKIILKIDGMTCAACSSSLEKYLNKQKGIISSRVNLASEEALIEYDSTLNLKKIEDFIAKAGFKSLGTSKKTTKYPLYLLIIYGFLSILVMFISMHHSLKMQNPLIYALILLLLTIFFLIYGLDILKKGFKSLIHMSPNMDTLVSIGILSSLSYSLFSFIMIINHNYEYANNLYFESCCIVIYFIKLGRYISQINKEKTTLAIQELTSLTPQIAHLKKGEKIIDVSIDEVKKGDILICKPGEKIAVDGVVKSGKTHVDVSFLTGEAMPLKRQVNDEVKASSLNIDGYIEYVAQNIGKSSTISEIVNLVKEASLTKAPIETIADKVSSYFVPLITLIAVVTFLTYLFLGNFSLALNSFVCVLVVACPCSLGLATPLAIVISMGQSAKRGILIKNSSILEACSQIDTIVFDKTGTLTNGNLTISKIHNYSHLSNMELLKIVISIERYSSHPISRAFREYSRLHRLPRHWVYDFKEIEGMGLTAVVQKKHYYIGNKALLAKHNIKIPNTYDEKYLLKDGNTLVYIAEEDQLLAIVGIKDEVRSNAKKVVTALHHLGISTIMLTGDNQNTAQITAQKLGITQIYSEKLPKDKTNCLKELLNQGKNVMMVGDGINDAPSLALATIGVSFNESSDIATSSADVILIHNNLENILDLITISKQTLRIIKQNLFWAFLYNILMIPLATNITFIKLNPMIASLAMMLSSLTVVFNSLRLNHQVKLKVSKE